MVKIISKKNKINPKGIAYYKNIINKQKSIIKAKNKLLEAKDKKMKKDYKNIIKCCSPYFYSKYERTQTNNNTRKETKKNKNKTLLNSFKNLLENLNKKNAKSKNSKEYNKKHVNKIISKKIGDNISNEEFLNSIEKSIEKINSCWTQKDILKFKKDLENLDYNIIDIDSNNPLSLLKKDIIIDLFLQKDYESVNKDIRILEIKKCCIHPLTNGFKFVNPQNNEEYTFDKNFIKTKILNNIGIINSYYKTIQKFTKFEKIEYEELKKNITNMIDNTNIFFCDLPNDIYGVTISNGDIYIRSDFLKEALLTPNSKNIEKKKIVATAICKIYLTLLHEFAHKLHYLMRKINESENCWLTNFFDHSQECDNNKKTIYNYDKSYKKIKIIETKKIHLNKIYQESGDYFDNNLYLGEPLLDIIEDTYNFFLFEDCYNKRKYENKLKKLKKITKNNNNNRASNSKYKIIQNISRCFFSVSRNLS